MAMKVLVATKRTQGARDNDFACCVEDELVWIGLICATDRRDPDGGCGCGRAFGGLSSHRGTTTAMVRDIAGLSREDYAEAIRSSFEDQGWPQELSDEVADGMLDLVRGWPAGAVVERRIDEVIVRALTPP
jgi:hypothetical protein